jgi:hypothetical protein
MLNLFQHPWPGAFPIARRQLVSREDAKKKKIWADRPHSLSMARPVATLKEKSRFAASTASSRLRVFA